MKKLFILILLLLNSFIFALSKEFGSPDLKTNIIFSLYQKEDKFVYQAVKTEKTEVYRFICEFKNKEKAIYQYENTPVHNNYDSAYSAIEVDLFLAEVNDIKPQKIEHENYTEYLYDFTE